MNMGCGMVFKLARKRTEVYSLHTEGEEDGKEGHKELNDQSLRIAEISCILASTKVWKRTQQTFWKGGMKTALTEHNKQNQASGVCNYEWNRVLWSDQTKINTIHLFCGKEECIQGEAPHTYWVIDVFGDVLLPVFKINGTLNLTSTKKFGENQIVSRELSPGRRKMVQQDI